jgi:DNA-binding response OmpR family regulator
MLYPATACRSQERKFMSANGVLEGRHVLVVEDEMMIAMLVEDMLSDLGCIVVGPAHGLDAAMALAQGGDRIDAALLDVNLAGQPVFAVADALRAKGMPVVCWTARSPADWDRVRGHCDNLIFEGFTPE